MTKYEWETELRKNIHRLPSDEIKRVMEYYDELFADKIERGYGELEIISQFGNPADVADKIVSEYDGELADDKEESAPVYESKRDDAKRDDRKREPDDEKREPEEDKKPEEEKREPEKESDGKKRTEKEQTPDSKKRRDREQTPDDKKRRLNGSALALFIVLNVLTVFAFFIVIGALWIAVCGVAVGGIACIGGGVLEAIFSFIDVFRGYAAAGFAKVGMCVAAVGVGVLLVSIIGKVFVFYGKVCAKIFKGIGNWIYPIQRSEEEVTEND